MYRLVVFFVFLYILARFSEINHGKNSISSILKSAFYFTSMVLLFIQYFHEKSNALVNISVNTSMNPTDANIQTDILISVILITALISLVEFVNSTAETVERTKLLKESESQHPYKFVLVYLLLNLIYIVFLVTALFIVYNNLT